MYEEERAELKEALEALSGADTLPKLTETLARALQALTEVSADDVIGHITRGEGRYNFAIGSPSSGWSTVFWVWGHSLQLKEDGFYHVRGSGGARVCQVKADHCAAWWLTDVENTPTIETV